MLRPSICTTQMWVLGVTRHQYGIFALVTQSFHGGEINSDVAKRRLFSLTKYINKIGLMQYSFLVQDSHKLHFIPKVFINKVYI